MNYQNPAFMVAHPMATRAIADIATRNSSTLTDDSKRALIDSRQGEVASFTATANAAGFSIDYGAALASSLVNRCVIPAGHTFTGFTVDFLSGATLGTLSSRDSIIVSDASVLDFTSTTGLSMQFFGIQASVTTTQVLSLSEFWVGNRRELTSGDARVDQGFEREYEHDLSEDSFGGRTTSLELSPARRKFSLRIRGLDPTGADFATLEEVIRDGRSKPFWYWTPDDTDTGPYLVKLTRAGRRRQSSKVPTTYSRYEMDIEMLEQVT